MTLYKRKWNCAVCDKPVIWDSERLTLTCSCKVQENVGFVNMEAFTPMPKYDKRIWKQTVTIPIDCAKFLDMDSEILHISDRNSIIAGNENPQAELRWIHYPKDDKIQLCIEISGRWHKEQIVYNKITPQNWKGRMWIFLDTKAVEKVLAYLQRDPQLLASWR